MNSVVASRSRVRFVLECTPAGRVRRILHTSAPSQAGKTSTLHEWIGGESATLFLAAVRGQAAVFDFSATAGRGEASAPEYLSGVLSSGRLLVAGGSEALGAGGACAAILDGVFAQASEPPGTAAADSHDERILDDFTRLNNELANLQRTLTQQNRELAALSEVKNRFVGVAAHDLRGPLGAIQNLSEVLLGELENLSADHRELLELIHSTSRNLIRLVNDLLDVSTIESGRFELKRRPADLVELCRRTVEVCREHAGRKKITVNLAPSSDVPSLALDADQFERVLTNLVSNAIKFSPAGAAVKIAVSAEADAVVLTVRDNGPGIPAEEQRHLFEPFGRTSVRPTGGEPSTGLGLAIVRRIVEAHGGRVEIDSAVGVGTTVRITLPRSAG